MVRSACVRFRFALEESSGGMRSALKSVPLPGSRMPDLVGSHSRDSPPLGRICPLYVRGEATGDLALSPCLGEKVAGNT